MNDVKLHCREIDRCNQRGGRMLSIVDLVEAGTVPRDLAAYLLSVIEAGASFMVGAVPGGAGKTTVMGALLNFVPPDVSLAPADSLGAIRAGQEAPRPRKCFICHEIGRGHYYSYLWGDVLREYFKLARAGHLLATNLHADNLEQARGQICGESGVPREDFLRMNLGIFLDVSGPRRKVAEVWESDGESAHRPVYSRGKLTGGVRAPESAAKTIERLMASGARTIEQVRKLLVVPGA
jgi:hypothetical protein